MMWTDLGLGELFVVVAFIGVVLIWASILGVGI